METRSFKFARRNKQGAFDLFERRQGNNLYHATVPAWKYQREHSNEYPDEKYIQKNQQN